MPPKKIISLGKEEQAGMLREIRRTRYGHLLALHILLLYSRGKTPTEISEFLFCSRSSVYRAVEAYGKAGKKPHALAPWLKRSLLALLKKSPSALGWCRTRWSCSTLCLEFRARHGIDVSAETMRRWLHQIGWVWKRAKLIARDDDPLRAWKLARIRHAFENLRVRQAMVFSDEIDIHLLSKVGCQWMPKAEQVEVMTPGVNRKHYLAAALDIVTGTVLHTDSTSKNSALFIDLLTKIDSTYTKESYDLIWVVADNYGIHKSKAVERYLSENQRIRLLFLPSYCPRANPIERVFGDVHENCTRNHKRRSIQYLVSDVRVHFKVNGPWKYHLSRIYYEQDVDEEFLKLAA